MKNKYDMINMFFGENSLARKMSKFELRKTKISSNFYVILKTYKRILEGRFISDNRKS